MQDIRLIASDMDHTLLTEQGQLPPGFADYINRLDEKGIRFVVASGRPMYTLKAMFSEQWDKLAVISDNGAAIVNQGDMIYKSLMRVEDYQEMIRFVEDETEGVSVLCALEGAYVLKKYERYSEYFRAFLKDLVFVDDMRSLDVEANKFTVFLPEAGSKQAYDTIYAPRYQDRFSVTIGGDVWIDIMNKGVDKGMAMEKIGEVLGVDTKQMMAFGDNYNDAEMLKTVYHSYIVANAQPGMEQFARFRAPSNEEYGVLQIMEQVLSN
ncbi:MAG: HAD family hydrolase [Eubacteriales bacterium]|nr:HAD family hydrolase [Eubacteriales bacterium]